MMAVQIERYGGPEALILREVPKPVPRRDEVLVKLAFSGINFMDIHTREGKYANSNTYPQTLPTTLGIEGSGVIEEIGSDVHDLVPGDRIAYCLTWGSYAEFAVVPASRAVRLPAEISLKIAAAALFHGLTAHYLANDVGRLGPGISAAVLAASGGIGQLLVQLGARAGATMYAVTSSGERTIAAEAHGAAKGILYEGGRFADIVRNLTSGQGVDVVYDPIGKPTFHDSLRAARKKGLIVSFGSVGGPIRDIDPIELGESGSLFLTRPRLADHISDSPTLRRRAMEIFQAIIERSLFVDIEETFKLADVERAHHNLARRKTRGKQLIGFS